VGVQLTLEMLVGILLSEKLHVPVELVVQPPDEVELPYAHVPATDVPATAPLTEIVAFQALLPFFVEEPTKVGDVVPPPPGAVTVTDLLVVAVAPSSSVTVSVTV
jgi:hypothetical protein